MNCPHCDAPMARGLVEIDSDFRQRMAFGLSGQSLWWAEKGKKRKAMLEHRSAVDAFHCAACNTLVVPTIPPPAPAAIEKRTQNELAQTVFRTRDDMKSPWPWRRGKKPS
jgi:uncharacterized protein DUF6487